MTTLDPRFAVPRSRTARSRRVGLPAPGLLPRVRREYVRSQRHRIRRRRHRRRRRFVVTWQEFDDNVLGRRFDRLAVPVGDPFPVNAATTNAQDESSIAMDAQGRFVAVWMEDAQTIWGRRFDADGTPLSGDFQVNTSTTHVAAFPHVASDPSGNFVVAWTAASAADPEVMARRFDSNGTPLGDEFQVNSFSTGYQAAGGAAMSPAGFVVSWGGEGFGNTNGIFARLFDSAGNPVTDDLEVNPDPITAPEPSSPDVAMSAKGDFVVVWDDGNPTYGLRAAGGASTAPRGATSFRSVRDFDAREPRVTSDASRQLSRLPGADTSILPKFRVARPRPPACLFPSRPCASTTSAATRGAPSSRSTTSRAR